MSDEVLREIDMALPRMRDRWLGGGDAANVAPVAWRGDAPRLLALAGHALETLRASQPDGAVSFRPLLPKLALPPLMDERRPLLRRALAGARTERDTTLTLIRLLVARGFTVHPEDWRPSLQDLQSVDTYAPWAAWSEGAAARAAGQALTAETWSDWSWSERRVAFQRLRVANPAAGRELLQRVFASELAEKRVVLLSAMAVGLAPDDAAFLEALSSDRSENVKQLARQLLTRLGKFNAPGQIETELAEFLDVKTKGILRRNAVVSLKPLKTPAQNQRLMALFDLTSLPALATHLEASEADLVAAWAPGAGHGNSDHAFLKLVLLTGSAAATDALASRIEQDFPFSPHLLASAADITPPQVTARFAAACIARDPDLSFSSALALARHAPGGLDQTRLAASSGWRALIEAAASEGEAADKQEPAVNRGLVALGVMCTSGAARFVIDRLNGSRRSPADPAFNILSLNAALREPYA
jgi:hypothetical protein